MGTIKSVDSLKSQMVFTVTDSCGKPSSGTWRINFASATFDVNSEPTTEQGEEVTISKAEWLSQARRWKQWHILVAPSGAIDISNGPYGACSAYSFPS
ncbi:MAG: hypothetical protein ACRD6W_17005 [Nitrososphaerales archaeon]